MSHGGMVVKISKCLIGLPYIALDVIVEFGGSTGKGPKVWIGDLMTSGRTEIVDPIGVKDGTDEDHTIFFEGTDLFVGNGECFGWRDAGCDAMGKS